MKFVNDLEFIPKTTSFLCSQHFSEDCFDRTSTLLVRLRPNATPTIKVDRLKYVSKTFLEPFFLFFVWIFA